MRAREAKRLHNRDEVEARVAAGVWEPGYFLGEPDEAAARVAVSVQTRKHSYREVDHSDVG